MARRKATLIAPRDVMEKVYVDMSTVAPELRPPTKAQQQLRITRGIPERVFQNRHYYWGPSAKIIVGEIRNSILCVSSVLSLCYPYATSVLPLTC